MKVHLDVMTNPGRYISPMTVVNFGTTITKLLSQVLSPPELECTWITVQVFCPSTASLTPWLSSTESRPHSLSRSVLDFGLALEALLSCVNSNKQKSFQGQWVKVCVWILELIFLFCPVLLCLLLRADCCGISSLHRDHLSVVLIDLYVVVWDKAAEFPSS